mmetsp:Transcript_110145/g.306917  ORF Transcript_110145/g.306917 Transcript_110145/m.306917 type:complete len:717 (+) Transcript_110145:193-2343(+)
MQQHSALGLLLPLLLGAARAARPSGVAAGEHRGQVALMADRQLGLALRGEGSLDFTRERAPPLVDVLIHPQAENDTRLVALDGACSMTVSIDLETGELHLHPTPLKEDLQSQPSSRLPVAWARYNNTIKRTGWAYLSVGATIDARISKEMKAYAAGFLEGFVSAKSIRDFQHNAGILLKRDEDKHQAMGNIRDMFNRSLQAICAKSGMMPGAGLLDGTAPEDPWWRQARYALLQAWGILDAYNHQVDGVKGQAMSLVDLLVLNSDGETPELEMAYDLEEELLRQSQRDEDLSNVSADGGPLNTHQPAGQPAATNTSHSSPFGPQAFLQRTASRAPAANGPTRRVAAASAAAARRARQLRGLGEREWRRIKESSGRCSALVRLTAGNKDLMVGHTTFSDYSEMTRIFKYYDLPLGSSVVQRMGFSSYPGVAGSTDDYYLLDSGLVVTETTISMLTDEPYDRLENNGERVPDFMRIMLANRLAKTAHEWAELMRRSATGTYSSQWMVVDYGRFEPGSPIKNGTLVVLEQVPGLSHAEDMSGRLQATGFWASENRPWYKDVRDSMGATEAEEIHGSLFSADQNPRARIFTATAPQVQSLADMRAEMRRNRWPHEANADAGNTPDHAIAARGDLDVQSPNPNGGVDAKVTNSCLARRLRCDAISGPTAASQKPFRWTDTSGRERFAGAPHDGLPDIWNFDWVRMTLEGESIAVADADCGP